MKFIKKTLAYILPAMMLLGSSDCLFRFHQHRSGKQGTGTKRGLHQYGQHVSTRCRRVFQSAHISHALGQCTDHVHS